MGKRFDVAVAGDINVDLIFKVDSPPKRGEMAFSERVEVFHGGVGGNVASALSKLGLKVALIGAVGGDSFGSEALRELERVGVDVKHVKVLRHLPTGLMAIAVDKEGERTMMGSRGANAFFQVEEGDLRLMEESSHLHVSGYWFLNRDRGQGLLMLLEHARRVGVSTSMDLEGAARVHGAVDKLSGLLDYVMAGEREARGCFGVDGNLAEKMVRKLAARIAVVKLGARGCSIAHLSGARLVPGFKVKAVDSTGAGDAFNAALIYGLLRGLSPEDAARMANAAGAYKCAGLGPRHHPTVGDLLNRFPELRPIIGRLG